MQPCEVRCHCQCLCTLGHSSFQEWETLLHLYDHSAKWRGVFQLEFLHIGLQCISRVRNFITSVWPFHAAEWRGVFWLEFLHIGSQRISRVRNFLHLYDHQVQPSEEGCHCQCLCTLGRMQCTSRVRNFTTSVWSFHAPRWRGVFWLEFLHIGSQSNTRVRNFITSLWPPCAEGCHCQCLCTLGHSALQE